MISITSSARISRRLLISIAIYALTAGSTKSADTTFFRGAVVRDGAVQLLDVELIETASGLSGRYDLPDLGLYSEPLTEIARDTSALRFRILYGPFDCLWHHDLGEITGINDNWKPPVRIHLKQTAPLPRPTKRPVRFQSGDVSLAGTLVLPNGHGPHPAVVVIHGSGAQGLGNWTYRSYGDFFAGNGVAALVYDKRGVGMSMGDFEKADFETLASDALAAVEFLMTQPEVDRLQVGLFGISQGGWLATLAANKSDDIAFLILNVGPAVSVWEQGLHRVEYSMRADGYGQEDIGLAVAHTRLIFDCARNPDRWPELKRSTKQARLQKWREYVNLPDSIPDATGWLRQDYDPSDDLKRTTVPLLALYGAIDVLVPPAENVEKLRHYLTEGANRDFTIKVFPGTHDMETYSSLIGGDWSWPEGFWRWNRKAPGFYQTIIEWVHSHTR